MYAIKTEASSAFLRMSISLLVFSFLFVVPALGENKGMNSFKADKTSEAELKKRLSPLQYHVTKENGTEPPFRNEYWNNHRDGLYVDIISGKPLFSSIDKFDSGTGWPSFTRPLEQTNVEAIADSSHGMTRVEVRAKDADAHLGHVFDDGPGPDGKRYCINSAALRFVPVEKLVEEGYSEYLPLFSDGKKSVKAASAEPGDQARPEIISCSTSTATATLAGGCFWGMEDLFRAQPGVLETEVGYTGGDETKANYEAVKTGNTGHAEALRVIYDPKVTSLEKILKFFFKIHDPTTLNRQGGDIGSQYRSAVFVENDQEREIAEKVIKEVQQGGLWKKPIVTKIETAKTWHPAEAYHQDYLKKNPGGYTCHYERN